MSVTRTLADYKAPDYFITHIDLELDLTKKPIQSKSRLVIRPNPEYKDRPKNLILDGEKLRLKSITLKGKKLEEKDYLLTDKSLTISNIPEDKEFTIETEVEVEESTDLFGLYKTEGVYLVKAETEGLRKVLFCKDRPDVLATYTTTITADEKEYPILLANGDLKTESIKDGKRTVVWEDKIPKPSYLFALVAGDLKRIEDSLVTKSGRTLPIKFHVNKNASDKCNFAIDVLKAAMQWDEKTYDLECQLPQYMVAGIDKYASGASEPTGLNLFNTQYLLATPEMKTDAGFITVAEVVSHEFFHYWTGDRVTIRDWFNLVFKEGLTSFRAQKFLEDTFGKDLMRIFSVKNLRQLDCESKPARPDSCTNVRNLYTSSTYEKGAEIFRMIQIVLTEDNFHTKITQFLKEQDGKATTIESLLHFLNLPSFLIWFTQAGKPVVDITDKYDPATQTYTLKVKQSGSNSDYKVMPIPIKMGLLDEKGHVLTSELKDSSKPSAEHTLLLTKTHNEFRFTGVTSRPVPSLFRDYSAFVKSNYDYSNGNLLLLVKHDPNTFNRWQAMQQYVTNLFHEFYSKKQSRLPIEFIETLRSLLQDKAINPWILGELLSMPSEAALASHVTSPDFDLIHEIRELIVKGIAKELHTELQAKHLESYTGSQGSALFNNFNIEAASHRYLQNVCLNYLIKSDPENAIKTAMSQFEQSLKTNMTNAMAALGVLADINCPERARALALFYTQWESDPNAINYWFRVQASSSSPTLIADVAALIEHKAFDITNPNKVYSLFRPFISNPAGFHSASGEGYKLLADVILKLDTINPQTAANLVSSFVNFNRYDEKREQLMREQLRRIDEKTTSSNVREILKPALEKMIKKPYSVLCTWERPVTQTMSLFSFAPKSEVKEEHKAVSISLRRMIKEDHGS